MSELATTPLPRWQRRVREEVYDHVFGHPEGEVGGVLVGRTSGDTTVITAAIPALRADGRRASVTFTHEAWAEVHDVMDRDYPGQRIVGWYHSHPGFGIFLSDHDLFIHRNFFSDIHQVAFVVDPHAATQGTFGWSGADVVKLGEGQTHRKPARPTRPVSASLNSRRSTHLRPIAALVVLGVLLGVTLGVLVFAPSGSTTRHRASPRVQRAVPFPEREGLAPGGDKPTSETSSIAPVPGAAAAREQRSSSGSHE